MPANKFLGVAWNNLLLMRTSCQNARMAGQAVETEIAGVRVKYDPGRQNLNVLLDEIQYAISQHENADADNPAHVNPYTQRPGMTNVSFV